MNCGQSDEIRAFLQEKRFLENISPRTIILYESSFKAFEGAIESLDEVKKRVVELRTRGVSFVTVNTYLRDIKYFYLWRQLEWKLPWLKEDRKALSTLSPEAVRLVTDFKPAVGANHRRAHLVALRFWIRSSGERGSLDWRKKM